MYASRLGSRQMQIINLHDAPIVKVSESEYLYWLTYLADMVWTGGYASAATVYGRLVARS